ncbi:hypothetical protein BVG16_00040 [Paenibacillus selenitireducens]|uniref:HTH merR-type domain-containing protein n=1 Tax=Paenibacillus selenitireducens TaxID=1324314 RepID=A0A1T2XM15_9BACL|nr:hypothetical protein BVG16_00040 [Paenibacillus selenitireducens]
MKQYLRKYELAARLDVNRHTLGNWISDFREFIPIHIQGDVECFDLEAIAVLMRIKTLRKELYSKRSIRGILANEGYPIQTNNR